MAREDMIRFQELLNSDAEFRNRFSEAAEAYTGEKDEKSVFEQLLLPFAKEYGLSGTYEEFREYIESMTASPESELSEDELAQVAGGKGRGYGETACLAVGVGVGGGGAGVIDGGACFAIGLGTGHWRCQGEGV